MNYDITQLKFKEIRELALAEEIILITPAGMDKQKLQAKAMEAEAKELKKKLGETAHEYPDLRENATFDVLSAQLEHQLPEQQLALRRQRLKSQLYAPKRKVGVVGFDAICQLENVDGQLYEYWLAGPVEAALNLERAGVAAISYLSPIGRAIWNAKLGDTVEVHLPASGRERFVLYTITGIS